MFIDLHWKVDAKLGTLRNKLPKLSQKFCSSKFRKFEQNCHSPNNNRTQPQHWCLVGDYNDCAYHTSPPPHKLKGILQEPQINNYWQRLNMMWPITTCRDTMLTFTTTTTASIKTTTTITKTQQQQNQQPLF